jgi:hypothetical protein
LKKKSFLLKVSILLVLLSLIMYSTHYLVFRDAHFLKIYILDHLAFVPIEILLVTVIIGSLLEQRDKNNRIQKMNMVIGTFYAEVGRELLILLSSSDPAVENKKILLKEMNRWSGKDFTGIQKKIRDIDCKVVCTKSILAELKQSLVARRDFLLRLMENPNLLEHDKFTDLMQAVFHLLEELQFRSSFDGLPQADYNHLSGDAKRAYTPLLLQWIDHLYYLRQYYPYLFSLAARTNPFDQETAVIVQDSPQE